MHILKLTRFALFCTLLALLAVVGSLAAAIAFEAHKGPIWIIDHFRCGFTPWKGIPLPYCELKSAPQRDKVPAVLMLVTAIIVLAFVVYLFVRFERKDVEGSDIPGTERPPALPPPLPQEIISSLPREVSQPQRRLTLVQRIERISGDC